MGEYPSTFHFLFRNRIAGPKVEDLIATWKTYTVECHQRVVQCKVKTVDRLQRRLRGKTTAFSHSKLPVHIIGVMTRLSLSESKVCLDRL